MQLKMALGIILSRSGIKLPGGHHLCIRHQLAHLFEKDISSAGYFFGKQVNDLSYSILNRDRF